MSEAKSQVVGGDIFLRGVYLQMGINQHGYCGSHGSTPAGFVHSEASGAALCAMADPHKDGWDVAAAGKVKHHGPFTIPGSPQEAWIISYRHYGSLKTTDFQRTGLGNLNGFTCTFADITALPTLGAMSICTNSHIRVTQELEFHSCATHANWHITVEALYAGVTDVRYMRNMDPDNDLTKKGTFMTVNTIHGQKKGGDGYSLVAATSNVGTDSYFGLFSRDDRSTVRYGGFNNQDTESSQWNQYGSTFSNGKTTTCDCAIDMLFTLGDLSSGQSTEFDMTWVFDKNQDLSLL